VTKIDWEPLIEAALAVRERAYAPYSKYKVGAALLGEDGRIYIGCNVENAAYPVCLCAEHAAIASAVSQGCRRFRAIVVATAGEQPGPPCGVCRQAMREFSPEIAILLVTTSRQRAQLTLPDLFGPPTPELATHTLPELLPHSFGPSMLDKDENIDD
jgi:cytidine deaminase